MSEQFNNKDYGDYFSAVEKSIEKNSQTGKVGENFKPQPNTAPQTNKKR